MTLSDLDYPGTGTKLLSTSTIPTRGMDPVIEEIIEDVRRGEKAKALHAARELAAEAMAARLADQVSSPSPLSHHLCSLWQSYTP